MGVRKSRVEGDDASVLVQAIRLANKNDGIDIRLGTIMRPLPNLTIKVDGISYELERDDFLIDERLLNMSLDTGDRVFVVIKQNDHYVIGKAVSL